MTQSLQELLFAIRQHSAFQEFMEQVKAPAVNEFKPSGDAQAQYADFIYRSGRQHQQRCWLQFLIGGPTSEQEKS